jgi:hypothetical protein
MTDYDAKLAQHNRQTSRRVAEIEANQDLTPEAKRRMIDEVKTEAR